MWFWVLLPTLPSCWQIGCICFPALVWVIDVTSWPLEEAVELAALFSSQIDAQARDKGLNCHWDGKLWISQLKVSRWWCLVDRLHVLLRKSLELLLSFCELGLVLLHLLKHTGVLALDLIQACLKLCLLHRDGFELSDLCFELLCQCLLCVRDGLVHLVDNILDCLWELFEMGLLGWPRGLALLVEAVQNQVSGVWIALQQG